MKSKSEEFKQKLKNNFVRKSKDKYPGRLKYDSLDYINTSTPVILECIYHGKYEIKPSSHLFSGMGCKTCAKESYRKLRCRDLTTVLSEIQQVHGGKYEYDFGSLAHIARTDRITIFCQKHGKFEMTLDKHLCGRGCKVCGYIETSGGTGGYNETNLNRMDAYPEGPFYVAELGLCDSDVLKIGITINHPKTRLCRMKPYQPRLLQSTLMNLDEAYELEQLILSEAQSHKPQYKFGGHRECVYSYNANLFFQEA